VALGRELYAWRKSSGITQAALGERVGISPARIADLE
jgi:transcriptional regulator with XRE-family HTH domain